MRVLMFAAALAVSAVPAVAFAQAKYSTATTTLEVLIADPAAKAVLDKHMPGVSTSGSIDQIKGQTLKALQGMAPDRMPDSLLVAIDADLAKLPAK